MSAPQRQPAEPKPADDRATWERLDALWDTASELDGEARERFLEALALREPAVAAELASLLAHGDDPSFLDRPLLAPAASADGDPWLGRSLGPYRLVEKLGEGGMSVVYRAERSGQGFEQQVAVKLLRGPVGPELERRFRAERQILAQLEHPHIARLLDGGTDAQGVPYVVMEYVRGLPLTAWCAARKLDLDGRLRLFIEICAAVHFAHRHLVVHRDLKPANILVDHEGRPRLLDFGIAKLLDPGGLDAEPTVTQLRALTPGYASPEQVAGRTITTASDVWALGVLLYELLAGIKPFETAGRSPAEVQRALETETPRPPSAVHEETSIRPWPPRQLRGDLDTIVLEALRPEPEARYPSAEALAQDLERYRAGEPILARPGTWGYRLGKLLRRNRLAAALALLLGGSILASAATATFQARRLARERDAAEQARQRAEEAARFLEGIFQLNDPRQTTVATLTTAELLDRQRQHVLSDLADQPELQARLLHTLGEVYQHAGLFPQARELLEKSLGQRQQLYGAESVETAETRLDLGMVLGLTGEHEASLAHLRGALATLEKLRPADDLRLATALVHIGEIERESGHLEAAEAALRRANGLHVGDAERATNARSSLANVLLLRGQLDEAKRLALQVVAELRAAGAPPAELADALNSLGEICRNKNELPEAEAHLRQAVALYPPSMQQSNEIGATLNNLGAVLRARGDYAEAAAVYTRALAMLRKVHGEGHHFVGTSHQNLAKLYLEMGDLALAESHGQQALYSLGQTLAPGNPRLGLAWRTMAEIYRDQGRLAEALAAADRAGAALGQAVRPPHPWLAANDETRGSILLALGRWDEAEAVLRGSLAAWEQAVGPRASGTADVRLSLAELAGRRHQPAVAEQLLGEALDIYPASLGADHPKIGLARLALAEAEWQAGRPAEARRNLDAALVILRARLPPHHPAHQRAAALAAHLKT